MKHVYVAHKEQEWEYAQMISEEVRGHPVGIRKASQLIVGKWCTLGQLATLFDEYKNDLVWHDLNSETARNDLATLWSDRFRELQAIQPDAMALLQLCAFLANRPVPVNILHRSPELKYDGNRIKLQRDIDVLKVYSLIDYSPQTQLLRVHPLLQMVIQADVFDINRNPDSTRQKVWAERAMRAVSCAFPTIVSEYNWEECQLYAFHAQHCLALLKKLNNQDVSADLIHLHFVLGSYHLEAGNYPQAETYLSQARDWRDESEGSELELVEYWLKLGEVRYYLGEYKEAKTLFHDAHEALLCHAGGEAGRLNVHTPFRSQLALGCYYHLIRLYEGAWEWKETDIKIFIDIHRQEVEKYVAKALIFERIDQRRLGDGAGRAQFYNRLGWISFRQMQYQSKKDQKRREFLSLSKNYYQRAERLLKTSGSENSLEYMRTLAGLAGVYQYERLETLGENMASIEPLSEKEIEEKFSQALRIAQRLLGSKHLEVAQRSTAYAHFYQLMKGPSFTKADQFFTEARRLYEQILGRRHVALLDLLFYQAKCYVE